MPTHPKNVAAGSDIVDYAVDNFISKRVYIACSDATIRIFDVPDAFEGDYGESKIVLEGA